MRRSAAARTLVLLAATLAPACAGNARKAQPLTRLLPALGPLVYLNLDEVTRPATLLRSGETRSCAITATAGTRLRLWIGLPTPTERGFVEVRVEADGSRVVERRAAAGRLTSWMEMSGDVPASARELKVTARLVTAHGRPLPAPADEVLVAVGGPRLVRGADRPPRIVLWISQDTVRADRLGAYGYTRPTTPVLDRLAGESLLFENAMATSSWTLPSLASQATSLLPSEHGAVRAELARRREAGATVFDVLSREGFTVLGATGNAFFSPAHHLADGFDTLLVHPLARADVLIDRLLQRLAEWDGGDLALFIHFMDPHLPYVPPSPYDTLLGAEAPPLQEASPAERKRAAWSAAYDGEIAWTDAQIGRLLAALDKRGLLEASILAYSADHGDELLDHGGFDHGHSLYEELVRVPLVVRVPGTPGRRIATAVSTLDLAPTLLDALDLQAPASFRGESLLGTAAPGRERYLYAETETKLRLPRQYAVRAGSLKIIVERSREDGRLTGRQLFDLRSDPGERQSLATDSGALDRAAEGYAMASAAASHEGPRATLDAEAIEQLKALGYIQ